MLFKEDAEIKTLFLLIFSIFSLILFQEVSSVALANDKAKSEATLDLPKNVIDAIKGITKTVTVSGNEVHESYDYDGNGRIDAQVIIINGKVFKESLDINSDGKFDRVITSYQSGKVVQIVTKDRNLDGKQDYKLIQTLEGARPGFVLFKTIEDNDFDGKFETKYEKEHTSLQAMGSRSTNSNEANQSYSVNCSPRDYENVHLPNVLDQGNYDILRDIVYTATGNKSIWKGFVDTQGQTRFPIKIHRNCRQEKDQNGRPLITDRNVGNALKNGLNCLARLQAPSADTSSTITRIAADNFRRALSGLVGYNNDKPTASNPNPFRQKAPLSIMCRVPQDREPNWVHNDSGGRIIQRLGYATYSYNDDANPYRDIAPAPSIILRPGLSSKLKTLWPDESSTHPESEKFQELVFHEYLHTALGTVHGSNENSDFAEACGDYCFNRGGNPRADEIKRIAKDICQGRYEVERNAYKDVIKRYESLKNGY